MGRKIKKSELWDLSLTFIEFILPRLIAFRKLKRYGSPADLESTKEWNVVIDKMIRAFKIKLKEQYSYKLNNKKDREKDREKEKEGMELFVKYFDSLWD